LKESIDKYITELKERVKVHRNNADRLYSQAQTQRDIADALERETWELEDLVKDHPTTTKGEEQTDDK
jgi:hypothetical protein